MRKFTRIISSFFLAGILLLSLPATAQYTQVTNTSGTAAYGTTSVTVTSSGPVGSASTCSSITASPYAVVTGTYTFSFSTTVAAVQIPAIFPLGTSTVSFTVNGSAYTITSANIVSGVTDDGCNASVAVASGGVLAGSSNSAVVQISGAINSISVTVGGGPLGPVLLGMFFKPNTPPSFINGSPQSLTVCENSGADNITSLLTINDPDVGQSEVWSVNTFPLHGTIGGNFSIVTSTGGAISPISATYTPNAGYSGPDVFTINVSDGIANVNTTINVTVNPLPNAGAIVGPPTVCTGSNIALSDPTADAPLAIGQSYGGGIIAYILQAADPGYNAAITQGLIAAPSDQGSGILWWNGAYTTTGATGTAIGTGLANTNTIIASPGATGSYAASVCHNLTLGGYTDWYLPSQDELNELEINQAAIGGFTRVAYYWSSSENNQSTAIAQYFFLSNFWSDQGKAAGNYVRAVRSFSAPLPPTLTWSSSNTTVATVSSSGAVYGVAPGIATISYTVTNGCSSASALATVSVNETPVAIAGNQTLCLGGSTTQLSDNGSPDGTWSSNNLAVASVGSATGVVTPGATQGTMTISYSSGCGSAASITATVNASPATITGNAQMCTSGSTITLANTSTNGTWSGGTIGIAAVGSANGVVTPGATQGTTTISYSNGCGIAASITATVNAAPAAISGNTILTLGGALTTTTLSDASTNGIWSSSTTVAIVNASSGFVTSASIGTTNITYANGCGTPAAATITVKTPTNALNFNGVNNYAQIPNSLSAANDFTIEYWVKTTNGSYSPTGSMWYEGDGIVDAEVPGVVNDFGTSLLNGKLAFGIGNPDYTIQSVSNINTGNWVFVAATWDRVSGSMNLYINGILETTGTSPGTAYRTSPSDIKIGATQSLAQYFNGTVDEVRIWNVVRTQAQIQANMNCDIPQQAGLIAYYRMDQGIASGTNTGLTYLDDNSGNYNCGTLNNMALTGSASNYVIGAIGDCNPIAPTSSPAAIAGNTQVCAGGSTTQLSDSSPDGGTWSGGTAGLATVNSSTGLVRSGTASGTTTINYTNGCSAPVSTTVTVNPLPTIHTFTGGGAYCAGSGGVPVGLTLSDTGITYQLYMGSTPVGAAVAGTGSAISFGTYATPGVYYAIATNNTTSCTNDLSGITISINPLPDTFTVTGGGSYCANGSGVHVGLDNSDTGINYQLYNGSTPVGSAMAGTGSALDFGPQAGAGVYTVIGANAITLCPQSMAGTATITVIPLPAIDTVTGGGSYCSGDTGVYVGLNNSDAGTIYQLYLGSAPVGTPDTSTGGAINFGLQTVGGLYTVIATNPVTTCVAAMTGSVTVTVNPLPIMKAIPGVAICNGSSTTINLTTQNALIFTGVNPSYVTIPNSTNVQLSSTNFTVSMWIYTTSTDEQNFLFHGFGCSTWASWFLGIGGAEPAASPYYPGQVVFGFRTSNGSGGYSVAAPGTVALNTWIQVTATYDGATLSLYENGLLAASTPASGTPWSSGENLYIGQDPGCGGRNPSSGYMDQLQIWNTTLSSAYIANNYTQYIPASTPGIVGSWSFDELSGSMVIDSTSNADNGTITGSVGRLIPSTAPGNASSYTWSPAGGLSATTGITVTANPTTTTVYTITGTSSGCSTKLTDTVTVTPIVNPHVLITTNDNAGDTVCAGFPIIFTAHTRNGGATPGYQWNVENLNVGTSDSTYTYIPNAGDVVAVTMISSAACAMPDTVYDTMRINTEIPLPPSVFIVVSPITTIQIGQPDTLTAVATNCGSLPHYQWFVNGIIVPGATNAVYTSNTFANGDSVTCMVITSGACGGQRTFNSVVISVYPAGITQVTGASNIRLFPNPNKGSFTISGTLGTVSDEDATVEITDMLGQVVYKNRAVIQNGVINEQIQLSNTLANGMYLLNLRSGSENTVFHFVIGQ